MLRTVLMGTAAGAVGSMALNIATYADMVIRGRAASETPTQVAGKLVEGVGIDPAGGSDEEIGQNRLSGTGSLLGYLTGLGVGTAYGLLRAGSKDIPWPIAAVGLGAAAMLGSDVPTAATGVSDPRTWPASSWISDAIPHLAYGIATAVAFDAFAKQ